MTSTLNKNKVALLVCGSYPSLNQTQLKGWLKDLPELNILADVDPFLITSQQSANITEKTWQQIHQTIIAQLRKYSGFVVLHNLDNILYSAAALTFMALKINKPIIFTSAQIDAEQNKLESKANLINSVQAATSGVGEVCLMFGNKLIRATLAKPSQTGLINRFVLDENSILGRVDFSIRVFDRLLAKKHLGKFNDNLNTNILTVCLHANPNLEFIKKCLYQKDGVIINAERYQGLPEDLVELLSQDQKLPVVIWWPKGSDSIIKPKNIVVINQMTWATTLIKFMWALAQTADVKKIRDLINTNIAGEIL